MEQQVLVMSRRRILRLIALDIILVGLEIMLLAGGKSNAFVGVLAIGFFGVLGLPVLVLMAVKPARLVLTPEGFTASQLGRSFSRRWDECGTFREVGVGRRKSVGYSTQRTDHAVAHRINRVLASADEALAARYGGLSARELADLLNLHRARALAQGRADA